MYDTDHDMPMPKAKPMKPGKVKATPGRPMPHLPQSRAGSKRAIADAAYQKAKLAKDCLVGSGNC